MTSQPSKACCTVPPATVGDYSPKGKYIELKDGMKCYATGPSNATTGIFIVFDIFGFFPQTLQGADILTHSDGPDHQYRVFMPDFFYGKPFSKANFPPNTPERQKMLGDFFAGPANPPQTAQKVPDLVKELEGHEAGQGITQWASLGMCWGGKVVALSAAGSTGKETPFSAAAEVHPAMVDPGDAQKISIPFALLASQDEDKELVGKFEAALTGKKYVETFGDQVHGWLAARADLDDDRVKAEYERGYQTLLEFYHQHL